MNQPSSAPTVDVDLWSDDILADPYPTYAQLRARGAVLYDTENDIYVLPRYDEVRHAVQDWETFTSEHGVGVSETGNRRSGRGILTSDPPLHDELRSVLNPQLVPRAVAEHSDFLDEVAREIVTDVTARGSFDVVTELARPYSVRVVADLCGLPDDEARNHFIDWSTAGFNLYGPDNELSTESTEGFIKMFHYAFDEATRDRLAPDRWGTQIYEAGDEGKVDTKHCPGLVMAYVWAGMDTTVNSISSAIQLFAHHPTQWERLRDDRSLMNSAINEVLRIEAPVHRFTRSVTKAVEIGGVTIPEGARVLVLFGSANRDERRFDDPDRFDIERNPTDHLTFGRGIHRCVGAGLAQQELRAVLGQLADRVAAFDVVDELWRRNNSLHGPERLVVTVS